MPEREPEDEARHIVLAGLPGVGKSSVGLRVARLVGRPFLDSDTALGLTPALHRVGRDDTHDAAERSWFEHVISSRQPAVITMPTAVLTTGFDRTLSGALWVVWLDASPETVDRRVRNDRAHDASVPTGEDEDLQLRERRLETARAWCDLQLDTGDLAVADAAHLIVDHWRTRRSGRGGEPVTRSGGQTALARSVGPDSPGT